MHDEDVKEEKHTYISLSKRNVLELPEEYYPLSETHVLLHLPCQSHLAPLYTESGRAEICYGKEQVKKQRQNKIINKENFYVNQ